MNQPRVRRFYHLCLWSLLAAGAASAAMPAETPAIPPMPNPPGFEFYFAAEGDGGGIFHFDATGGVRKICDAPMSRDVRLLPNGNLLFPYNKDYDSKKGDNTSGVKEADPSGKIVFHFQTTGQVFSCDRAADGTTLVGAASQGKILFVNPSGEFVRAISVSNKPGHSCMRHVRALPGGNFIVAEESASAVREYDAAGRIVHDWKIPFPPFSIERSTNGHTRVSGKTGLVELDANGKIVWQIESRNFPMIGIRWCAGFQSLEDGDVLVCNAGGRVPFIRLSRDGRVVWQSNSDAWPMPFGHGLACPAARAIVP